MKKILKSIIAVSMLTPSLLSAAELKNQSSNSRSGPGLKIELHPLQAILGSYSLGLGYGVSNKVVLGVEANSTPKVKLDKKGKYVSGYGGGLFVEYFFNQTRSDSFYTKLGYHHEQAKLGIDGYKVKNGGSEVHFSYDSLEAMGGYQWHWQSGFNIGLAGGLRVLQLNNSLKKQYTFVKSDNPYMVEKNFETKKLTQTTLALELTMGFMI